MSSATIKEVIKFLEEKNYTYLKPLGEGGFASVIAVLSPKQEAVAVKIIEKKNVGMIEDEMWPLLRHRNVLPVLDVLTMDKPAVKMYLTPMLPKALDETIHSDEFRFDPDGLTKIKLWMKDILLALNYLQSSGFCHCDLKTDNALIDKEGIAVLCDFSGLNYTGKPLEEIVSPFIFRPPEWFSSVVSDNVQGEPYDMYTFGLMALNMLTGHWPQMEWRKKGDENFAWSSHVWPVLKKGLRKQNFEYLMRKSLPGSKISESDIDQAFDFLLSILKMKPDERPSPQEITKHPFLKMGGNPFKAEKGSDLSSQGDGVCTNPFKEFDYINVNDEKEYNVQQARIPEIGIGEGKLKYSTQHEICKNSNLLKDQEKSVQSKIAVIDIKSEDSFLKTSDLYLLRPVQQFENPGSREKFVWLLENVTMDEMKKKKKSLCKEKHQRKDDQLVQKEIQTLKSDITV